MTEFEIPIKTVSEANGREHWAAKARRVKQHRGAALLMTKRAILSTIGESIAMRVELIRVSPRSLDTDNLTSALKATRDGIADALGIKDNDPRVTWEYGQEKGKPPCVKVRLK